MALILPRRWSPGGSSPTAGPEPLWRWNQVDTSQFGVVWESVLPPVLTVDNDAGALSGKVLKIDIAAAALGGVRAVHLGILDAVFPPGDYRIELDTVSTDALGTSYRGIFVSGDGEDSDHYSYALVAGAASWRWRVEAGTLVGDSNTVGGLVGGHVTGATARLRQVVRFESVRRAGVNAPVFTHRAASYLTATAPLSHIAESSFFPGAAPPVGWSGLACDRMGLALRHNTSAAGTLWWHIRDFRIYAGGGL